MGSVFGDSITASFAILQAPFDQMDLFVCVYYVEVYSRLIKSTLQMSIVEMLVVVCAIN